MVHGQGSLAVGHPLYLLKAGAVADVELYGEAELLALKVWSDGQK